MKEKKEYSVMERKAVRRSKEKGKERKGYSRDIVRPL
jgi:hypothetical protein